MNIRRLICVLVLALSMLAVVLALSGAQRPAQARPLGGVGLPRWGQDIQINPPTIRTPSAERNCTLAINPANPNMVIASYEDQQPRQSFNAYSWSTDAGRTWGGSDFKGPWGSDSLTPFGGASVAFDSHGTGYYTSLAVGFNMSGYFVLTT